METYLGAIFLEKKNPFNLILLLLLFFFVVCNFNHLTFVLMYVRPCNNVDDALSSLAVTFTPHEIYIVDKSLLDGAMRREILTAMTRQIICEIV